jgi:hypothetical protein
MRTITRYVAIIAGVMGAVMGAAASENETGNRGLSPIVAPAIYMAANTVSAQTSGTSTVYKLGVCKATNYPAGIKPTLDAKEYFYQYLHNDFDFDFTPDSNNRTDTSVRIIAQPKHGHLEQQYPDATGFKKFSYQYIPDDNYEGYDKFVMEISAGGNTVHIYYTMAVASGPIVGMNEQGERTDSTLCDRPYWKISAILDSYGNTTAVDYLSPLASTIDTTLTSDSLSSWLNLAKLDGKIADMSGVNVSVADLPGGAVGQTVGGIITLDTNAAGNGWFVDTTPANNSEFLPTSNTASGWNTQGSVDIVSSTGTGQTGTVTLNEVSTSQTRLSPAFMLGDRDRVVDCFT